MVVLRIHYVHDGYMVNSFAFIGNDTKHVTSEVHPSISHMRCTFHKDKMRKKSLCVITVKSFSVSNAKKIDK